jgi:hypothetical protein
MENNFKYDINAKIKRKEKINVLFDLFVKLREKKQHPAMLLLFLLYWDIL